MSTPALSALDAIAGELKQAGQVLFALDYDGTLAPIAPQPELAVFPAEARQVVEWLSELPGVQVAVVSGRALEDVKARVALPLIYAGNHGLELEGPDFAYRHPQALERIPDLTEAILAINHDIAGLPGVRLENKGLTASVHFRNAAPEAAQAVATIVKRHRPPGFQLHAGKKVIELRPDVDWHKGAAVCWLMDNYFHHARAFAMGDDLTDEDMYIALPAQITVCVAEHRATHARYRVNDVNEALDLLRFCGEVIAAHRGAGQGQMRR